MDIPVVFEEAKGRTSSVKIRQGKLVMRLSRFVRGAKRDEIVEKFNLWAEKRLSEMSLDDFVLPDYVDGGRIVTHNKIYELNIAYQDVRRSRLLLEGGVFDLVLPMDADVAKVKSVLDKAVMKDQQAYLEEVLREINELHFQAEYQKVRWRKMKSRFGSCGSNGNITLSYYLLFAPREVFRYVCVHELAHLKEFNHSRRFWDLVEEAMPDYKEKEAWLKSNGLMLG